MPEFKLNGKMEAVNAKEIKKETLDFMAELGVKFSLSDNGDLSIPAGQKFTAPERKLSANEKIMLDYALWP